MLRILLLTVGVTVVVLLGLMIDAQSRTPASHPVDPAQQYAIFAPGAWKAPRPKSS